MMQRDSDDGGYVSFDEEDPVHRPPLSTQQPTGSPVSDNPITGVWLHADRIHIAVEQSGGDSGLTIVDFSSFPPRSRNCPGLEGNNWVMVLDTRES